MRLIDADALPIKFDGHSIGAWEIDVRNAPTIDPVVHGYWIKDKYEADTCSICGKWETDASMDFNFCPHCGAKMYGEK